MEDFSANDWLIVGAIAIGAYMLVASAKNIAQGAASGGAAPPATPPATANVDMGGSNFGMEAGTGWDD